MQGVLVDDLHTIGTFGNQVPVVDLDGTGSVETVDDDGGIDDGGILVNAVQGAGESSTRLGRLSCFRSWGETGRNFPVLLNFVRNRCCGSPATQ